MTREWELRLVRGTQHGIQALSIVYKHTKAIIHTANGFHLTGNDDPLRTSSQQLVTHRTSPQAKPPHLVTRLLPLLLLLPLPWLATRLLLRCRIRPGLLRCAR